MTKIGIDVQSCHKSMTGMGVYTHHLVKALIEEKQDDFEIALLHRNRKGDLNTWKRLWWENWELPKQASRHRIDLLHTPAFTPPWINPCPHRVMTVHDLIGMTFSNQIGLLSRYYWSQWLPAAVKRSDRIIAVSQHTKQDLMRLLAIPESKIRVIYSSGHEGFSVFNSSSVFEKVRTKVGIKYPYFLAVGTLEPRKNLENSLKGFARFCAKHPSESFHLVLVGSLDFAHGQFADQLRKKYQSIRDRLVFTGYVDHDTLNQLYSNAQAFLFPSLYEGFGIPILEAMASGTPVIASQLTSLPEIAGEAALYVDAKNPESMAEALEKISADTALRQNLIKKGLERIRLFSWKKCAKETLEVYRECLSGVSS